MDRKRKAEQNRMILAPMSGQAVPLEQVPDAVFSQKLMGDGMAIQPSDGKIYEVRNNQIGTFIAEADSVSLFSKVRAGFIPALPKIPFSVLEQLELLRL